MAEDISYYFCSQPRPTRYDREEREKRVVVIVHLPLNTMQKKVRLGITDQSKQARPLLYHHRLVMGRILRES
jgi:hypothetical protein